MIHKVIRRGRDTRSGHTEENLYKLTAKGRWMSAGQGKSPRQKSAMLAP